MTSRCLFQGDESVYGRHFQKGPVLAQLLLEDLMDKGILLVKVDVIVLGQEDIGRRDLVNLISRTAAQSDEA